MDNDLTRRSVLAAAGGVAAASVLTGTAGTANAAPANLSVDGKVANEAGLLAGSASGKRPNLVLFLPDEMRADALGCYGNKVCKTPNFDALAAAGTRFEQCHVQYPVCVASRCAMLTGWYPHVRGHRSQYALVGQDEPNMFRYLREAGYDVYWYGKNDALVGEAFNDSVTQWGAPGGPTKAPPPPKGVNTDIVSMLFGGTGDRTQGPDYGFLELALEALKNRDRDRPFCLYMPGIMPHPPYRAPSDFFNMYDPDEIDALAPIDLARKPHFYEAIRKRYNLDKLDEKSLKRVRAAYYGMVSYSDWIFGELKKGIEALGHGDDTAYFITSDHGDYAGDFGLVEKWPSGLDDCLTHVPMIGYIPGAPAGQVASNVVEMFDVMPTMLELAGTAPRHTQFARSLVAQVHGAPGDPDRAAFTEGGYNIYEPQAFETIPHGGVYVAKTSLEADDPVDVSRCVSIRTKDRKLVVRPQGQSELYDCARDRLNTTNLIGSSHYAKDESALRDRLINWYVNTSTPAKEHRDSPELPPYNPAPTLKTQTTKDKILDL